MLGLGALKIRLGIGGGFVSNPNLSHIYFHFIHMEVFSCIICDFSLCEK